MVKIRQALLGLMPHTRTVTMVEMMNTADIWLKDHSSFTQP